MDLGIDDGPQKIHEKLSQLIILPRYQFIFKHTVTIYLWFVNELNSLIGDHNKDSLLANGRWRLRFLQRMLHSTSTSFVECFDLKCQTVAVALALSRHYLPTCLGWWRFGKKKDDFKLVRNNSSHDHDFFSDMISGDWIHPKKGLPYIALFPATEPSFGGVNWRRRTLRPHDSLIKVKSTNYTTWIKFNLKMKLDVEGLCGALVFLWINRRRESFW